MMVRIWKVKPNGEKQVKAKGVDHGILKWGMLENCKRLPTLAEDKGVGSNEELYERLANEVGHGQISLWIEQCFTAVGFLL